MKVVDANILLYAVNNQSFHHLKIKKWWEDLLNGDDVAALPWVCLLAFIRISTNPRVFSTPLRPADALATVDSWLNHPNVDVPREHDDHWEIFQALLANAGTAGNLSTDAHLAALAISHGAILASCDSDFNRFQGLRLENPLQS